MESQHQNPEFRNNPENFHPCIYMLQQRQLQAAWVKVQNFPKSLALETQTLTFFMLLLSTFFQNQPLQKILS